MATTPKITQRISLDGAEEIKKQLNDLGKEGEKAFANLKKAIDDANKSLADAGKNVQLGLDQTAQSAEKAGEAFFTTGVKAQLAGAAVVALGIAVYKLTTAYFDAAVAASKFVTEQANAATRAGQTTKNYRDATGALQSLGLKSADAEQLFKNFGAGAAQGIEQARVALKALGITFPEGVAGAKEISKWMGNVGGVAKKAGAEIDAAATAMRLSGAVIDPLTGRLRQDAAAWQNVADNILKIKDPLKQVETLMKGFKIDEGAARLLLKALSGGAEEFKKAVEDIRRITGNLTDEQIAANEKVATAFEKSLFRFGEARQAYINTTGILAAELFTSIVNLATEAVVKLNELFSGGLTKAFDATINAIKQKIDELVAWVTAKFQPIADLINKIPTAPPGSIPTEPAGGVGVPLLGGESFSDRLLKNAPQSKNVEDRRGENQAAVMTEQFRAAVEEIKTLIEEANTALVALATSTAAAITSAFGQIAPAVEAIIAAIAEQVAAGAAAIGEALLAPFQAASAGIESIMAGFGSLIDAGFASLNAAIAAAAAEVEAAIAAIIASLEAAVAQAQALAAAAASAGGGGGGGGGEGLAAGGFTGFGGKYQPAGIVHRGEYVQPQRVVRQPGVLAFMETLRRSGDLQATMSRFVRGFSTGGLANGLSRSLSMSAMPGFAGGGLVDQMQPVGHVAVDLRTDRGTARVMASRDVARELERWSIMSRLSSAGRLPREG